jgi:hypothetical protein
MTDGELRKHVFDSIEKTGMTTAALRAAIYGLERKQTENPCCLSMAAGFGIVLERIAYIGKEYRNVLSILVSIESLYPEAQKKNILAKIQAVKLSLEALDEYTHILGNIKESLNSLPVRFFD